MFGELSVLKLLLLAVVVLVLFGRGKVADMMGEFGRGVKSFKQGIHEGEQTPVVPPERITAGAAAPSPTNEHTQTRV